MTFREEVTEHPGAYRTIAVRRRELPVTSHDGPPLVVGVDGSAVALHAVAGRPIWRPIWELR